MAYTFQYKAKTDLYTASIGGVLSVKPCGASIPSHYRNMMTNSASYSTKLSSTGKLTLDALPAPTNKNCTLSAYSIEDNTASKGLKFTSTCSATKTTGCLEIAYPITSARLTGGSPAPFSYNLVAKYSSIDTAAYKTS